MLAEAPHHCVPTPKTASQKSLEESVALSWDLAQVHRTVKGFPTHIQHQQSACWVKSYCTCNLATMRRVSDLPPYPSAEPLVVKTRGFCAARIVKSFMECRSSQRRSTSKTYLFIWGSNGPRNFYEQSTIAGNCICSEAAYFSFGC